jgi:hypothetical protein
MNSRLLEQIVEAVLYEGYVLYPYRPSSKKNARERFTFGRIYPETYSIAQGGTEACSFQTECLLKTNAEPAELRVSANFLQPMAREIALLELPPDATEPAFRTVSELRLGEELFQPWLEAVERRVCAPPISVQNEQDSALSLPFGFGCFEDLQPIHHPENTEGAVIIRRQAKLEGMLKVEVHGLSAGLFKITVRIANQTAAAEEQMNQTEQIAMRTFASAHVTLSVRGGEFISLLETPAEYKEEAGGCRNIGLWPILVGGEGERDMMLASPIILYDYPQIAPESAGPLFDGTEIDEILTLRILTMTDEEKREMRHVDERARQLLERTEALPANDLLNMHGVMRTAPASESEFNDFFGANTRLETVPVAGVCVRKGDRVRIRPKARADAMDMALSGKMAVIEAIEQDLEQRVHLALVLDEDPGRELGLARQTGHRFFFGVEEVEVV